MSDNNRINTKTLKEKLPSLNKESVLIDVRSQDEHLSGSIPGAICIPHDKISECTAQIPKDKEVLLYCRSGGRSSKAKESLKNLGYKNVKDLEGGITAWAESGSPMHKQRKAIPIQRQVLLTAGILILISMSLGYFVSAAYYSLAASVGLGLTFAGASGYCGLAMLLEKMPWNKTRSSCSL